MTGAYHRYVLIEVLWWSIHLARAEPPLWDCQPNCRTNKCVMQSVCCVAALLPKGLTFHWWCWDRAVKPLSTKGVLQDLVIC